MRTDLTTATIAAVSATVAFACAPFDAEDYEVISSRAEFRSTDPTVPSELFLVRTYGDHRIRIERVCGREHCKTIGFLEYLEGDFPRQRTVSHEITELTQSLAAFVREVVVVPSESGYSFDLVAENAYVGGPLFTLRITPTEGSQYTAVFTERHDDSDPNSN